MVLGYAVKDRNGINVATVSRTAREAKANWLVTEAKVIVTRDWTEEDIYLAFKRAAPDYGAVCIPVTINETSEGSTL